MRLRKAVLLFFLLIIIGLLGWTWLDSDMLREYP